jgi:hypothetical protein
MQKSFTGKQEKCTETGEIVDNEWRKRGERRAETGEPMNKPAPYFGHRFKGMAGKLGLWRQDLLPGITIIKKPGLKPGS